MNKRTWSILVFAFSLGITMFIPLATMADYIDSNGILHKGLVECDPSIPIGNPDSCDMCALLKTIQTVFEWVMGAIFVVATGILIYNGVLFYFSQGQPANVNKIIGNIKNVVIGIIIVMASFIIINTILNWFAAPGSIPTFWNNIECVPGSGGGPGPTPAPACEGPGKVCKPACTSFGELIGSIDVAELIDAISDGTWQTYLADKAQSQTPVCPAAAIGSLCILIPDINFSWPLGVSYQEPIPGTCETAGEICCSL